MPDPCLTPHATRQLTQVADLSPVNQLKRIVAINVRAKTIRLLTENTDANSHDFGSGDVFVGHQNARATKERQGRCLGVHLS